MGRISFNNGQGGFTLVEMAIVVVIVGLIITGIMIGRNLVEGSKVTMFIKQVEQFDTAINNFRTKYGALPGDLSSMVPPGNEDDRVSNAAHAKYSNTVYNLFRSEIANFWVHLSQSGAKAVNKTFTAAISADGFNSDIDELNAPVSYLGETASFIVAWTGEYNSYELNNYNSIASDATVLDGAVPLSAFTTTDIQSVESKIDDRNCRTGAVRASRFGAFAAATCCTNPGGLPVISNAGNICPLSIRVQRDLPL